MPYFLQVLIPRGLYSGQYPVMADMKNVPLKINNKAQFPGSFPIRKKTIMAMASTPLNNLKETALFIFR